MEIKTVKDYDALSACLADEVLSYMVSSSEKLICLPSGDTPLGAFKWIAESLAEKEAPSLHYKLVGLDEWVGMGRETEGSCQFYMNEHLYKPGKIDDARIVEFNAKAEDLENELEKMDQFLKEHGPLDLVVLGIGMNGHLGLNEPGTSFKTYSHIVPLTDKTKEVAQKYFSEETPLEKGITLGINYFLEAKRLIVIASGKHKADIIKQLVDSEATESLPASIVKLHKNSTLLIDEAAASSL
ncbi:6-phosphogluconolactonase [Niallia oryzisoli]|uniref:6-phosphogluconolactonase n=1 Tax=Niallia oryzisoli TaxID=1737571 RepID=UPI003735187B